MTASKNHGKLVFPVNASSEERKNAEEAYYSIIYQYSHGPDHLPYELRYLNPHPIVVSDRFLKNLRQFHECLAIALTNIVERWFTDKEASFPLRMPLERHEEDLLQVCYHLVT